MSISCISNAVYTSPGAGQTFALSNPLVGDLIFVWATTGSTGSAALTAPSGAALTLIDSWGSTGGGTPDVGYLYYYVLTGNEGNTLTFNFNAVYAVVTQMRGAKFVAAQGHLTKLGGNTIPVMTQPTDVPAGSLLIMLANRFSSAQTYPSDVTGIGSVTTGTAPAMFYTPSLTHAAWSYTATMNTYALSGAFYILPITNSVPWSGLNDFNNASELFTRINNANRLTISGSSLMEGHTHQNSSVNLYIQLRNADTQRWVTVWTGNGTVQSEFYLNGLIINFPTMNIDGIAFTDNISVNQNYHAFSGSVFLFDVVPTAPAYQAVPAPAPRNLSATGYTLNTKPKFFFMVSTPNGGASITNFEIQISSHSDFSSADYWDAYANSPGNGTIALPGGASGTVVAQVTTGNPLPAGTWYVRGRVADNLYGFSAWSAGQAFTVHVPPWNDTPNGSGFKAQWLNDLANVINAARQFRATAAAVFTDGALDPTDDIKALHITERRTALSNALSIVGVTPTWTDSTLNSTVDRKAVHITELRSYCLQT